MTKIAKIALWLAIATSLAVSGLGAWMVMAGNNTAGFLLMTPLLIYMEGGFGLGIIMLIVAGLVS